MKSLSTVAWPVANLGDAMEALALHERLIARRSDRGAVGASATPTGEASLSGWVDGHARRLGLEAEDVTASHDALAFLERGGPALVRLPSHPSLLLALARGRKGSVEVLAPDGRLHRFACAALRDALDRTAQQAPMGTDRDARAAASDRLQQLLAALDLPPGVQPRARALLMRQSGTPVVAGAWILRFRVGSDSGGQRRRARVVPRVLALATAHALQFSLWIASWALLGKVAFGGEGATGWLIAWTLLLLCLPPLRVWIDQTGAYLSIDGGAWLKRRLLAGAFGWGVDDARHQGAGQLFGRVSESEALETLGLGGGVVAGVAMAELLLAALVLAAGAGGAWSVAVLLIAVAAALALTQRYHRARELWTDARLSMTNDLVEKMVGRRTVLAQLDRAHWHVADDETLARYVSLSRDMDATAAALVTTIARGQLLLGMLALAPAFLAGASPASIAVGVGGTLLAYDALVRITHALSQLTGASVAWRQVRSLYDASKESDTHPRAPVVIGKMTGAPNVVAAEGLAYRHQGRSDLALRDVSLTIRRAERVVLEGASGAGKSTLIAILAGLRQPQSGLLLVGGLDRHTLEGDAWRRHVVVVPQFHENHLFSGTLAFNLLMGRCWPPRAEDLERAEALCHELALGPLLERMPSGMQQTVGESGWPLSHGERSRVFIARALLQEPELLVLDESFATLDPETAATVMDCVTSRADAVLLVAHR
jgi:ATP-binding cassette subfamily B protein